MEEEGTAEGLNRMDGQIKGKKTGLKLKCSLGRHQSEKTGCAPMKHHACKHTELPTHSEHTGHIGCTNIGKRCTHTRLKSLGTHAYIPIQLVHTNYGLGKSVSSVTSTGSLLSIAQKHKPTHTYYTSTGHRCKTCIHKMQYNLMGSPELLQTHVSLTLMMKHLMKFL